MTPERTTSILLVEDHSVIATSLAMALRAAGFPSVTIVGPDDITLAAVLDVARCTRAEIALLDVRTGGGHLAVAMVEPLTALGAKTLLFAATDEPGLISGGLKAGAEAIVDRGMSFERLVATLTRLAEGRQLIRDEERVALLEALQHRDGAAQERRPPFDALTTAEAYVLRRLIEGTSPKQIAYSDGRSISTVRGHIERIFTKLEVKSQREALALARAMGWPDAMASAER
jgi:two-component system nitrate/nitrite response regulator NarL